MSDAQDHYLPIADAFTDRLTAVAADRWSSTSPCPEWTARQLGEHVVMTHRRVLAMLDGSAPVEIGPGDDLIHEWSAVTAAMAGAIADPGVAGTTVSGRFGDMAFEDLVDRMVCADTLVHTWDLARAVGGDEQLDPVSLSHVAAFLYEAGDRLRVPNGFGPSLEAPPGADEQTLFLAFAGRAV